MFSRMALTAAAAIFAVTSCAGPHPSGPPKSGVPSATAVYEVDGYPLDRTLPGLLAIHSNLDTIEIVTESHAGKSVWLTNGSRTGQFISHATTPSDIPADAPPPVETPVALKIVHVLRHSSPNSTPERMYVAGGVLGTTSVSGSPEVTIQPKLLHAGDVLLVAGKDVIIDGAVAIDPWFIYRLDTSGMLHSLMESSGSAAYPSFSLSALERGLATR